MFLEIFLKIWHYSGVLCFWLLSPVLWNVILWLMSGGESGVGLCMLMTVLKILWFGGLCWCDCYCHWLVYWGCEDKFTFVRILGMVHADVLAFVCRWIGLQYWGMQLTTWRSCCNGLMISITNWKWLRRARRCHHLLLQAFSL